MDFIDTTNQADAGEDRVLPFILSSRSLVFRSRRAVLRSATVTALSLDMLLERSRDRGGRITPFPPMPAEDRPFGLFKAVSAMRERQGYRAG